MTGEAFFQTNIGGLRARRTSAKNAPRVIASPDLQTPQRPTFPYANHSEIKYFWWRNGESGVQSASGSKTAKRYQAPNQSKATKRCNALNSAASVLHTQHKLRRRLSTFTNPHSPKGARLQRGITPSGRSSNPLVEGSSRAPPTSTTWRRCECRLRSIKRSMTLTG